MNLTFYIILVILTEHISLTFYCGVFVWRGFISSFILVKSHKSFNLSAHCIVLLLKYLVFLEPFFWSSWILFYQKLRSVAKLRIKIKILFKGASPHIKVTGFISVCLSVLGDLANHNTDMVFLYNVASSEPWEGS